MYFTALTDVDEGAETLAAAAALADELCYHTNEPSSIK